MYCVGLTGNIASGKSTLSTLFKNHSIRVISADEAARKLTALGKPALSAIAEHFGPSVLSSSGELNRSALREEIFSDPNQRLWLEQLLHPMIRQYIQAKLKESEGPYVLIEIPLLYRRKDYPYLDRVLLVLAKPEQQIERVMLRDKISRAQAESILAIQEKEENLCSLADDIIKNEGSLKELAKKVENLHRQYLQFASQKSS